MGSARDGSELLSPEGNQQRRNRQRTTIDNEETINERRKQQTTINNEETITNKQSTTKGASMSFLSLVVSWLLIVSDDGFLR